MTVLEMLLPRDDPPTMAPGTVARCVRWSAHGCVLWHVSLTKLVLLLTLESDEDGPVDCIARVQDGWQAEELKALAEVLSIAAESRSAAHVEGFPERLPLEQGGSLCLHVQRLELMASAWRVPCCDPPDPAASRAVDTTSSAGGLGIVPETTAEPPGDVTEPASPRPLSVNPKSNASRFPAFAEFLLATFGHPTLTAGRGVLDVAGGSGGLAFELSVRRQIPCVVVDPRKLRLTSSQRFVLEHRRKVCEAVAPWTGAMCLPPRTTSAAIP